MRARSSDPTPNGPIREIEDPRRAVWAEAFGYGMQDLSDAGDWGAESVEGGVSTRREFVVARLAEEILDRIMSAMMAIADEGVDSGIGDPMVGAIGIGAGLAVRLDRLLAKRASPALALSVGHDGSGGRGWG